jgi:hypothetical protein
MEIKFTKKFKKSFERMFSMNPIYAIPRFFRDIRFNVRMGWQRLTRGYDDSMVWGFCDVFPDMMVKILTQLEEKRWGHPSGLTDKQWSKILNQMIDGFKAVEEKENLEFVAGSDKYLKAIRPYNKRINKALDLFKTYFFNLWD